MAFKLPNPKEPCWPDWNTALIPIGALVKINHLIYNENLAPCRHYEGTGLILSSAERVWTQDKLSKTYIIHKVVTLKEIVDYFWIIHTPEIIQIPE